MAPQSIVSRPRALARCAIGLSVFASYLSASALAPVSFPSSESRVERGGPHAVPPARYPIHWRIGSIDSRFDLGSEQVKRVAEQAVRLWEADSERRLFVYDDENGFPVNLVFDKRQETAMAWREGNEKLRLEEVSLEQAQRDVRDTFDKLKEQQARLDSAASDYDARLDAYNRRVDSWNSSGGAPPDVLAQLNAERRSLDVQRSDLERASRDLGDLRTEAHRLVLDYNERLDRYRASIKAFNDRFSRPITLKVGECVTSGPQVKRISIFAFQDTEHLAIELAHEFGHALGLKHVKGAGALMSAVEDGEKSTAELQLTSRDRTELRRVLSH